MRKPAAGSGTESKGTARRRTWAPRAQDPPVGGWAGRGGAHPAVGRQLRRRRGVQRSRGVPPPPRAAVPAAGGCRAAKPSPHVAVSDRGRVTVSGARPAGGGTLPSPGRDSRLPEPRMGLRGPLPSPQRHGPESNRAAGFPRQTRQGPCREAGCVLRRGGGPSPEKEPGRVGACGSGTCEVSQLGQLSERMPLTLGRTPGGKGSCPRPTRTVQKNRAWWGVGMMPVPLANPGSGRLGVSCGSPAGGGAPPPKHHRTRCLSHADGRHVTWLS